MVTEANVDDAPVTDAVTGLDMNLSPDHTEIMLDPTTAPWPDVVIVVPPDVHPYPTANPITGEVPTT